MQDKRRLTRVYYTCEGNFALTGLNYNGKVDRRETEIFAMRVCVRERERARSGQNGENQKYQI